MPRKVQTQSSVVPLVSVIVPVFNGEHFIGACLDSILGQSLTDIEVIVVNDASTDSTREIVQEYAARDVRIELIDNEVNLDSYAARIRGFNRAIGRYIAACDSDDQMPPDALRQLVDAAEKTEADIVDGRIRELDGESIGRALPVYDPFNVKTGKAFVMAMLRNCRGWNICSKLFRRSVWCRAKHSLPTAQWHTADDLLTCFAIGLESVRYQGISEPVYLYRHPKTHAFSSQEKALKNAANHLEVLEVLFAIARQKQLDDEFSEQLDRLTKHVLLSLARNLHSDAAIRNAVSLKIGSTIGMDYTRWAVERGLLRGDNESRKAKRWSLRRLLPLPGKFLRYALESGSDECWVTLRRAYGAARQRGWRAVMQEIIEV